MQTSIRENLLRIQQRIASAAARTGRRAEDITLIGVSKTHPAIAIQEAYQAGVLHFGENRVQEWEVKRVGTNNLAATWHLIGHLQSNKAAKAAKLFHTVDSVDDFVLAQKLDRARTEANLSGKLRVLLEVRVAKEETKSGVEIEALFTRWVRPKKQLNPFSEGSNGHVVPRQMAPHSSSSYLHRWRIRGVGILREMGIHR